MFIRLIDAHNKLTICNAEQIECVFVGKIDRKGNTATIVRFNNGDYCCISESVLAVAQRIGSPMFLTLKKNSDAIVFNILQIERIFTSCHRKANDATVVVCKSGYSYVVSERVSDIYQALMPIKNKTDN